jgi:hypothetical protein
MYACRLLRQVGNGSVSDGVITAARNPSVQSDMAAVLGIPLQHLVEDLAQLRLADNGGGQVDISSLYCQLATDSSVPVVAESELNEQRAIFNWYAPVPSRCTH